MRITISSSQSNSIDKLYLDESERIIEYLAKNGHDLNWGSGCRSIMRLSYDVFSKYNRNIYGYTTLKYEDEINELPNAFHTIYEDTFDLKKHIYNDADVIVCLPGGTGGMTEFFSFVEESRSNDNYRDIIAVNINHQFDSALNLISDLIDRKFNSEDIYNYFKVANSYEEFVKIFEEIKK